MIGVVFLAFIFLYLALSVGLVIFAGKWAKKRGRRRWPWCITVGLLMYLLIAWEQIPTFLVGRYYCATKAGITVYKTPDQWLAENPGIENTLVWHSIAPSKYIGPGEKDVFLNQRLIYSIRINRVDIIPVNIINSEIYDVYDKEILARQATVSAGYGKRGDRGLIEFKIWVGDFVCDPGYLEFFKLMIKYAEIGKEAK